MSAFLQDPASKTSIENLRTTAAASYAAPESSEVIPVSVCRISRLAAPTGPRFWEPMASDEGTLKVAVSQVSLPPLDGVYSITFGADTTADLAFDATAAQVQTALNLLASIIAAGGVTVRDTDEEGGLFSVRFNLPGDRASLTCDSDNLAPENVHGTFGVSLPGGADVSEVQIFRLVQNPATFCICDEESEAPAASVEVVTVGNPGNHKVRVRLYEEQDQADTRPIPLPYDGRWSITVAAEESALLAHDASAEDVVAAMEAMTAVGSGNVSVFLESEGVYLIGFQGDHAAEDMGTITADGSALRVIPYMTGQLDFRTAGISLLLGDADSVDAVRVIEWTPLAGVPQVIGRESITINRAIIEPDSVTPTSIDAGQTAAQVSAIVQAAIGASQTGTVELATDATEGEVEFAEAMPSADYAPYAYVVNTGDGIAAVGVLSYSDLTVDGFKFKLSGPAGVGAILHFSAQARGIAPVSVRQSTLYASDLETLLIDGATLDMNDGAGATGLSLNWSARCMWALGGVDAVFEWSGSNGYGAPTWLDADNGYRITGSGRGLAWTTVPATAADPGATGQISFDGSYIYRCTGTDTWERAALTFATW